MSSYKDPLDAQQGLTSAFGPTTDAQRQAISQAAALVPGQTPTAPVPSPIQPNRTIDPGADAAESFLGKFTAPESADAIAERLRQSSSGYIDSINKTFDDTVAAAKKTGDERVAMDNAVSVLSGLIGSTEATRTRGNVLDANDKEVQAINNQRMMAVSKIYTQITQDAENEARQQMQDATKSAEDILARRTANQAKAVDNLKLMASSGVVDFDSFKSSPQNAKVYQYALDSVGGSEDALKGLFMLNRPKDQLVGTPQRIGNKYVQAYQKMDGTVKMESIDLPFDLPDTYSNFQKLGDNLVAIPDNWDGDMNKLRTVYGGTGGGINLADQGVAPAATGTGSFSKEQLVKAVNGLKLSESQSNAVSYALRMIEANKTINDQIAGGYDPTTLMSALGRGVHSDNARSLDREMENFIRAQLRKESGAQISDTELAGGKKIYDPSGVLTNKNDVDQTAGTRLQAVQSMIAQAGPAGQYVNEYLKSVGTGGKANANGDLQSQLQPGEILVRDKASGQTGALPEGEFDASRYDKI